MVETGTLDQVTQQFIHAFRHDATLLAQATKGLFYKLVVIQLTVTALWMSIAGENLQKMFLRLLQLCLGFGVLYACIEYGSTWVPNLLNGFIELGQQAGVSSISPSTIIDQGVSIASGILHAFFNWGLLNHPFISFLGTATCLAIIVIYAFLASELAITLIKSYALVSLSSLFFAFGGIDITRPMAINFVKTVLGIGLQLMTLYFLIGVGQFIGSDWAAMTQQASQQHALIPMLIILASAIVYYLVVKNIPPFIAGLAGVGGFKNYGESAIATAIHASMAGASHLSKGSQLIGKTAQGLGQATQTISTSWPTGKSAAGHVAHAVWKSAQDAIMKRNTNLSFGQRLNQHLANRVNPTKE